MMYRNQGRNGQQTVRFLTAALAAEAVAVSICWSGIRGTAHDFSAAAWNNSGEICLPCHTPHHAQDIPLPLWNRQTSTTSFTLYQSDSLDASLGQPSPASKACLSCHDGTIALNAFGGNSGTEFLDSGTAHLGTDLSDDHPISFAYDSGLASRDGDLFDPDLRAVPALGGRTITDGLLIDGQLECSSCHDVHASLGDASFSDALLIVNNDGSALCLTCHDK
jgi:predicted CXXCH cytochrome family protein